ncbi:acyl-CoA N-acyltransferase [Rhexocercosporidium sp. MPI-PUGE-AT-0058]|nr:acyl-CoA N-acyltransferase [Rhexocercosporidium sp. MPI-PUGE-AT-0058]
MADQTDDWSTESNDALHISMVVPDVGATQTLYTFNPKMTYSIFGDDERIFGYKGLKINLRYNASDMRPNLQVLYSRKFTAVGETEATDVKGLLEPFLPKLAFEKPSVFDKAISDPMSKDWKPPGELWQTIDGGGQTLEIWKGNLADVAVQQLLKRIQILVPLFIEGGTIIELDEPEWTLERWTVFFYFQKDDSRDHNPYTFMGYSTVYRYFHFQAGSNVIGPKKEAIADFKLPLDNISFSSLPCRSRISQFVILPPFQGNGYGSRFYNSIFDFYLAQTETVEITVEDPNYAFDDMRDINDLIRLRALPEFNTIKINDQITPQPDEPIPNNIVDLPALEKIRKKMKIAPRQFLRVVEMHLLSYIPKSVREADELDDSSPKMREFGLWQLWVKKRLYKHNKELLSQMEKDERLDKLDEVLAGVVTDYERLLNTYQQRLGHDRHGKMAVMEEGKEKGKDAAGTRAASNGKRPSPGEDDDDSEEGEPLPKRPKV